MKKIIVALAASLLAAAAMAQKPGDSYTVTQKDGKVATYQITDDPHLRFTDENTLKNYITFGGEEYEDGSWNVGDLRSVSFNVQHESDLSQVSLADADATDGAKKLYRYLKALYGARILSGVSANVSWNHDIADKVYQLTGKHPAINCYDFIHICVPDNNGWIDYNDLTPVTEWAQAGGIVSLMWHFNVPKSETTTIGNSGEGATCTPSETTFKAANALKEGTWENRWYVAQLERVETILLKLQEAGVTALWRPYHEAAGNATLKSGADWGKAWFWWGADGAETYKALWKDMFERFKAKGIHNLIWVWTSQNSNGDDTAYDNDAAWYPGNAYVDIVGRDLYGTDAASQSREYRQLQMRYPEKLVTLAECGASGNSATADVKEAWDKGAHWSWFLSWYGTSLPADDWWKTVMSNPQVLARENINPNGLQVDEPAQDAVANLGLGFNLGNTLDANGIGKGKSVEAYETAWGQPQTTQAMMTFLKKNGFNCVRIPVTWYEHMDEEGNIDDAWMGRVKAVVDMALNAGLYAIINVHHDTGAGNGAWIKADIDNYQTNKARFEHLWTQIANTFIDYDRHLLFEGYNEMLDNDNTWNAPKETQSYQGLDGYAQTFVDAVRATGGNNATRNIIVNTYAAAKGADVLSHFTIPTDPATGHLIVEVHSYDPWNFFNDKTSWDDDCHQTLVNIFSDLRKRFSSVPFIIGEYGTAGNADASGKETSVRKTSPATKIQMAADQAADMTGLALDNHAAAIYWMSIFDGTDRSVPQWTLPTVVAAMKDAYMK